MKKNPASQSGLFNARLILALCLCSVGLGLTIFSFASTPSSTSTATATVTTTAPPGTPRFFNYMSPQGVADSSGQPSIGSNWTREEVSPNHNVNGSINNIPNAGTSLYFGGVLPPLAESTRGDCSFPSAALREKRT